MVVFYILLELQRKVDFSMPYRLLHYMSGIWQNHLRLLSQDASIGRKSFRLPAIVPIVLYNGERDWTAARSFRAMLAGEKLFGNQLLDFEYILLQVNRYEDAELLGLSNTIGAAFLLDKNSRNPQELRDLLQGLCHSLQNATTAELVIFLRWVRYIFKPRLPSKQQDALEETLVHLNKEEANKMVFANLEKSLDAIEEEGRQKGRMEFSEETALEMLRDKMDVMAIAKYTKLPLDKIHKLAQSLR